MIKGSVCFLGFAQEEMDLLEQAAEQVGLRPTENGEADLVVVNGHSNALPDREGQDWVALVESQGCFYVARQAGAMAVYQKQKRISSAAIVLGQMVLAVKPGLITNA